VLRRPSLTSDAVLLGSASGSLNAGIKQQSITAAQPTRGSALGYALSPLSLHTATADTMVSTNVIASAVTDTAACVKDIAHC
jgi:hypothetical protein